MSITLKCLKWIGLVICFSVTPLLQSCERAAPIRTTTIDAAAIGGPFTLVNHEGIAVTEKTYQGKPQLIYFGFSFCPDVCPTSLQRMGAATDLLGDKANDIYPIFITIDPERDTVESLKPYLSANGFPKNLIGLTGTQSQIDEATAAFRVYKKRVDDPISAAGYTMDHTDIIYLMDKNGLFVEVFTSRNSPADIAKRVTQHLKSGR